MTPEPRAALPPLPDGHQERARALLHDIRGRTASFWRDQSPHSDSRLVGKVEIPRGSRQKREYDIRRDRLTTDRVIHASVGGFPVNYGFVPRTLAHDGDPLDVLILGGPLPSGEVVQGRIVAIMHMRDQDGYDGKIVMVPATSAKQETHGPPELDAAEKARIAAFFNGYKEPEADEGKWSEVTGWGSEHEARKLIALTSIDATLDR